MKFDLTHDRVLAVVAHPDDAELLCAGTLARAHRDGAAIAVFVLCRGDKGQGRRSIRNLAAMRRREMTTSAGLLQAKLFTLNQPDGALQDTPALRLRVVEVYRQFKPTLVLAHWPEDYHPDHRAAAALAEAASWFCASRGHRTRSRALDTPPALWWMDTVNMSGFTPSFYLDITDFLPLKTRMLKCHQSQLQRGQDADFRPLEELMNFQARARGLQAGVGAAEGFRAHDAFKRARAW